MGASDVGEHRSTDVSLTLSTEKVADARQSRFDYPAHRFAARTAAGHLDLRRRRSGSSATTVGLVTASISDRRMCARQRRRQRLALFAVLSALMLLSSCAPGPNLAGGPQADAGFWLGLWHGVIVPVTFVISLFTDAVSVYEVSNTGNWYDFGFVFGVMMSLGGGGAGAGRRR